MWSPYVCHPPSTTVDVECSDVESVTFLLPLNGLNTSLPFLFLSLCTFLQVSCSSLSMDSTTQIFDPKVLVDLKTLHKIFAFPGFQLIMSLSHAAHPFSVISTCRKCISFIAATVVLRQRRNNSSQEEGKILSCT